MVFDEDLLDAGIGAEFETAEEFVSPLHADIDLIVLTEAANLLKLSVVPIDKHQVLRLGLDKELLEGVPIDACLKRKVARATLHVDFSLVCLVQECLRVLIMQVFKSIVLLFVRILLDDSRLSLLHLDAFLLVQDKLLLLFLLRRHEEFLLVDLTVEGESGSLVNFNRAIRTVLVAIKGEGGERVRRSERFAVGFLQALVKQVLLLLV